MTSWFIVCLSFLYFFRSAATWGASAAIFRCECICFTNSGTMISRIRTTRKTIDSPHAHPLAGPKGTLSSA